MPNEFYVVEMPSRRGHLKYDWALMGPDGTVWHVATFAKQLRDRAVELNQAWELGCDRGLRARKSEV